MSDAERQAIWKSHNPMTSSTIFEASEGSPEGSREFYFDIHLEDMLVECQYGPGMLSCDLEYFTEWWHPTFGRCYTFNKTEMDDLGYEGKIPSDLYRCAPFPLKTLSRTANDICFSFYQLESIDQLIWVD